MVLCYSCVITGDLLQLCHYWCIVTVVSLLVHCYSCVITGALLQLCRYWCIVTFVSLLVHCYSCVITGALLQLCRYWCIVTVVSLLVHCYSCVYLFLYTVFILLSVYKILHKTCLFDDKKNLARPVVCFTVSVGVIPQMETQFFWFPL